MADDVLSISRAEIDAAQLRRAGLHRASSQLRALLVQRHDPLSDDLSHPARHAAVRDAVRDVAQLWERHVAATEASDGLLSQIVSDAPRLAGTVNRFRREHPVIRAELAAIRQLLERAEADVAAVAPRVLALLDGIDKHRRGGHELIYRAYCIDIGLGE